MNIVQMILDNLSSGEALNKIAPILGIGSGETKKALHASVPSVLAGLIHSTSKPGGGANLSSILGSYEHKDNASALAFSQGSNPLVSLLGGGTLSQISSVLARFTGLGEGTISKLLGTIAPVILGVIAKQSKGLDASGITSLLASQKENVVAAMPAGLKSMLTSAIPGLDSAFQEPSHSYDREEREPVGSAANRQEASSSWSALKWIVPLVIACLVIYALPRMFRGTREAPPAVGESHTTQTFPAYTQESSKLIAEGNTLIQKASDSVGAIKNEASATEALPKLRTLTSDAEAIQTRLHKLPALEQKNVIDALRPRIESLHKTAQPVFGMSGLDDQVKPTLNDLIAEFDKLATPTSNALP